VKLRCVRDGSSIQKDVLWRYRHRVSPSFARPSLPPPQRTADQARGRQYTGREIRLPEVIVTALARRTYKIRSSIGSPQGRHDVQAKVELCSSATAAVPHAVAVVVIGTTVRLALETCRRGGKMSLIHDDVGIVQSAGSSACVRMLL